MDPRRSASRELRMVLKSPLRRDQRVGIVAIKGYRIREILPDVYYETYGGATADSKGIERIAASIRQRLADAGGLARDSGGRSLGPNVAPILEWLFSVTPDTAQKRSFYPLNGWYPKYQTDHLLRCIEAASSTDRARLCEGLVNLYLWADARYGQKVRANAVHLLGRLLAPRSNLVDELRKRPPMVSDGVLFRTYHVSLSRLGDDSGIIEYANRIVPGLDEEGAWHEQARINAGFHPLYYGGVIASRQKLRMALESHFLHPFVMDAVTLMTLSPTQSDIDLVAGMKPTLVCCGLERRNVEAILSTARARLHTIA